MGVRELFRTLSILFLLLFCSSAHASANDAGSLDSSPVAKEIPTGTSTGTMLGSMSNYASTLSDPYSGSMTRDIDLNIPAGINGMQPTLKLVYKSSNGNGWLGVGWDLHVDVIVLNSAGKYEYIDASGTHELVSTDSNGNYSFKIVGQIVRIHKTATYWEVTDRKGLKYIYGSITKLADAQNVTVKWYLDKVIDRFGNYIRYNYSKLEGQINPDSIEYTGNDDNGGLGPRFKIRFISNTRSDTSISYRYGAQEKLVRRLETISITTGSGAKYIETNYGKVQIRGTVEIRSYVLTYKPAPYRVSVLKSVDEVAPDGTRLSVSSFGYTQSHNTFIPGQNSLNFQDGTNPESYHVIDVNGDGRADIAYVNPNNSEIYVATTDDDSSFLPPVLWKAGLGDGAKEKYRFKDVNGDGRHDLLYFHSDGEQQASTVCLSDGISSFGNCAAISTPSEGSGANIMQYQVADVTSDGKMDIIHVDSETGDVNVSQSFSTDDTVSYGPYSTSLTFGNGDFSRYIYTDFDGDGKTDKAFFDRVQMVNYNYRTWYYDGIFNIARSNVSPYHWGTIGHGNPWSYRIADFNGDGKSDVLYLEHYGNHFIALSTGKALVSSDSSQLMDMNIAAANRLIDLGSNASFYWGSMGEPLTYANYHVGDFNGDGKADLLWISSQGNLFVALSNGSKFTSSNAESNWATDPSLYDWGRLGDGTSNRYRVGDFNGDGKDDVVFIAADGSLGTVNSVPVFDNLLNHIETGQGGIIDIEYRSSTMFTNTQLPFAIPVVSSITVNDGNPLKVSEGIDSSSTTNINYGGGYYSLREREFRGFNVVTVEGPSGPKGERATRTTFFHQGDNPSATTPDIVSVSDAFMRGQPYRITTSDSSGFGFVDQVINYRDSTQLPHFNPVSDITVLTCINSTTCKSSKSSFTYDDFGNVIREEIQPDLNDPTHNRTVARTFDPNITAWIVSLPSSETIYQGIGTNIAQMNKTEYFYDTFMASSCAVPTYNTIPEKGKVTGIRYWLENGTSPEIRMAYDAYGNKICDRDARLNATSYFYDWDFKSYLQSIRRPGSLIPPTNFTYYGVDIPGNGFGQLKDIKDANAKTTSFYYDGFGRIIRTDYPDQAWERITYTDHSSTVGIGVQNVRVDNSAGLWDINYFDGMEKSFKTESKGPDEKIIVIDTVFDARDNPYKTSFPYFKNQETRQWSAIFTRDYLGRVIETAKMGETGNVRVQQCYGLKNIDTIDENGHLIRKTINGLGLVAEVDEFLGKYSNCLSIQWPTLYAQTKYRYDVMGRLTDVTDAKQHMTSNTYDTLGRKVSISDPDMGAWSYSYYPNGLLKTSKDAKNQIITYEYDQLNRLTSKSYPLGQGVSYTYDDVSSSNSKGRLTRMTDSTGHNVYSYDEMGRITRNTKTLPDGTSLTLGFGYLNGRLDSVTYPDNEIVSYVYNGKNMQKIGNYVSYGSFDALGRPWAAAYGIGGASSSKTYHPVTKRLATLSTLSATQVVLAANVYAYDSKGNITSITDNLNSNLPVNIVSESYTPARAHAVNFTGSGRVFRLDANGNIEDDGIRKITYNYDNLPVLINSTSFSYDGNGTRVKKTSLSTGDTLFYMDNFYESLNGANNKKYIFDSNSRVAVNAGGVKLYYHPDHQGSTAVVTNALGQKEESISYYPFGSIRKDEGTPINVRHKYTGQELDGETGLYNYGARLYDPESGRFMSPDSIVPKAFNPQSLNRYAYVANNPLNRIDPTGHSDESVDSFFSFSFFSWGDGPTNTTSDTSSTVSSGMSFTTEDVASAYSSLASSVGSAYNTFTSWGSSESSVDGISNFNQMGNAESAMLGMGGNGFGLALGAGLGAVPELTMVTNALPQNSWVAGSGSATNASNTLLSKVLTTGNVIAGVGLGLTTAAIALPEVPALIAGAGLMTFAGAMWSTYQYSTGRTSLAQHTVNGGISAGSLATLFIPAPFGPTAGVLMRALDVSNSAVGAFR